ncbi:homocysteine S-methyltransferase [Gemella sp.]
MNNFKKWLKEQKYVVIDGALSTALEKKGMDLNHKLWTAKVLVEHPEKIKEVHKEYYEAGANIAITSTYQASILGFKDLGYSEEKAEEFIRKSVELAKESREEAVSDKDMWIAGSVGPYGAYLADGSEYRGDYAVDNQFLEEFHEKRIDILIKEGVDLLAIETIPNLEEIKVLLNILSNYPETVAWVTCSLKDSEHISDGSRLEDVQVLLEGNNQVVGYGINCVKPEFVAESIGLLSKNRSKKIIAYPNGGAIYDPSTKEWSNSDSSEHIFSTDCLDWYEKGCSMIGGCCCTTKDDIEILSKTLSEKIK